MIQDKFGVIYVETFNSYTNDYDSNYLIPKTSPQNIQSIASINNKNWIPSTPSYQKTPVSSQLISATIADPSVSGHFGISSSSDSQRLIFSLHAPFSDITSSASTINTEILNSAGLYIMSNNIFPQTPTTTAAFEDSTGTTDASISVSMSSSSTADITYGLITFSASNSNGLLKAFAATAIDKIFAIKPFSITKTCSIYSDSSNYDFYLIGVDGIRGTYNQKTFNSYSLVNVQCISHSAFAGLKFSISNFWTGNSESIGSLKGNAFPALLYISGTLTPSESENVKKLAVFFQNVEPYSSLQNYNNEYYMACTTSDAKSNCSGVINSYPDYINYMTMNKVEFTITKPTYEFSAIIPLKTKVNQGDIYLYFATMTISSYYSTSKPYHQILSASKLYSWSFTPSSSTISYPFLIAGLSQPNYGLDATCDTCYPGNVVNVNMKIGHTDSGGVLRANDATNFAAGFTYISDTNLLTSSKAYILASSTAFTSSFSSSSTNPCLTFDYYYDTTLAHKYGFFCPIMTGNIIVSSTIGLTKIKLPFSLGRKLNGVGIFSLNNGNLASAALDQGIMANKGIITIPSFSPIKFYKGAFQVRITWSFQTTNPISDYNYIKITLSRN